MINKSKQVIDNEKEVFIITYDLLESIFIIRIYYFLLFYYYY
jgi:hypothetical protein